jgi:hypothetical protein
MDIVNERLRPVMRAVIESEQVACGNCKFVNVNPDLTYACYKSPPTAVGAFVQGPRGSVVLQPGSVRPPVERDSWCGSFERKTV